MIVTGSHDDKQRQLQRRIVDAAGAHLQKQKYVAPAEILVEIGWLHGNHIKGWRQGRLDDLEEMLSVGRDKLTTALNLLQEWAEKAGLQASETEYVASTRDRRALQFTTGGDEELERAFRTPWVSSDLSDAKRGRLRQQQSKAPDLVVVSPVKDGWTCWNCGGGGNLLFMEGPGPLCLTCSDLDHLIFLPAGNTALTRRARKGSALSAVVVRWSRSRKRYERQGLLVELAALEQAEEQCLVDDDARQRQRERAAGRRAEQDVEFQKQFSTEIRAVFPSCPADRATAIAEHATTRGSGRVGRTAAAQDLDHDAVTMAVVASIRHEDTNYDSLLMTGMPREAARTAVRPVIDTVLDRWKAVD